MRLMQRLVCLFTIALVSAQASVSKSYLVLPDGSGDFPNISTAVAAAADGDTIALGSGLFLGPGNRDVDFFGKAIVIRSDTGMPELTVIDCEEEGRGFVFHCGEGPGSVIEGVTIIQALAPLFLNGGGIYCDGSSPTIQDCIISHCDGAGSGGGVLSEKGGTPKVIDCLISDNCANYGGGVACLSSNMLISGSRILDNLACWDGGGVWCSEANPRIEKSIIQGNVAYEFGGGVGCYPYASPEIADCEILSNQAGAFGGLFAGFFSSPSLNGCRIAGNISETGAGGVGFDYWCMPNISKSLISGNRTGREGGGCYIAQHSNPIISSSTIASNVAEQAGGGIYCSIESDATLLNSILIRNCAGEYGGDDLLLQDEFCSVTFECCVADSSAIEGSGEALFGDGNVFEDPCFCAPLSCRDAPTVEGDYQIWNYSPCQSHYCGLIGALDVGCVDPQAIDDDGRKEVLVSTLELRTAGSIGESVAVDFFLPSSGRTLLRLYNVTGRLVRTLLESDLAGGHHRIIWDGRDRQGRLAASGVYHLQLHASEGKTATRLVVIR